LKYIVASAWPYSDYVPHLGTVIHLLSADVYSRYLRLMGHEVVFVTGSDEHGTPIELEARKRKVNPRELTDQVHEYNLGLFKKLNLSFSLYSRTESEVHKDFVKKFLMHLYNLGYIYPVEEELPYCPNDKIFLPDRYVVGTCPYCGYEDAKGDQCDRCGRLLTPKDLINPRCAICGATPEWRKTRNYYIDLSKVQDKIYDWLQKIQKITENVRKYSISWIKQGLRPRSITRDIPWGIESPFPSSKGKTIYVWFDALLGYLSATKEYFMREGKGETYWERYWKDESTRSVYFIGKDNIPFHSILLPGLLIASESNYILPWGISATEYLMYEDKKFSKSRKIGIWLDEAIKIMPSDYWRWVLIRMRPEGGDSNFTWKEFHRIVNNELNDDIGNFVYRVLSLIKSRFNGVIPFPEKIGDIEAEITSKVIENTRRVISFLDEVRLKKSTDHILEIARIGNKYLNDRAPWDLIKENMTLAKGVIYTSADIIRVLAQLLYPFMPQSSERLWSQLGYRSKVEEVKWDKIIDNRIKPGTKIGRFEPLFMKLEKDFLRNITKEIEKAREEARKERPRLIRG